MNVRELIECLEQAQSHGFLKVEFKDVNVNLETGEVFYVYDKLAGIYTDLKRGSVILDLDGITGGKEP